MPRLRTLYLSLFILTISACTQVSIKDSEWCGDFGPLGASCFHVTSEGKRQVVKPQWDAERFGMLCTKAENFAEWKAIIEKLCHVTKKCDWQTKQAIAAFFARVEGLKAP